ncbi:aquaporin-11-like [Lingula anatina]|uniref:Aquaporin n=1 Tax=Lingula anatina TaxID=7574 RepID=A0A1S3I763_LINAN|nr:aquaporin-11-like [Lingula anatina]XP_013393207.1 aquaporin-11-like [Lingula anatina]XP_013393209.1 aquaporin-11-like [Lingula anatina]|eukprot:XP_013393206.1 aquaporin-11-like [Lingula anatina]
MATALEEEVRQHHLGVTFFYLAVTTLLGHLLRGVTRRYIPAPYRSVLLDCISTLQLCSCTWENGFTFRTHGFYALLFQIFCLVNLYKYFFYDSSPNPIANLAKYFQGERPLAVVLVTMTLQMLAGQLSFYYAQCMWWLELSPAYTIRRADLAIPCVSDLTVTVFQGMLLEGGGCFIDRVFGLKQWTRRERGEQVLQALLGTLLTGAGLTLTGMYINPANASSQGFGCAGSSLIGHILVYWIAPSIGCYLSVQIKKRYFHNEIVHFVHGSCENTKEDRKSVYENGVSHKKSD